MTAAPAGGSSTAHLKHYSAGQVSVSFKAAGTAPPQGSALALEEAGFTIELGQENSVVFEAVGCRHERFADVDDVGSQILDRVDAKLWRLDYVLITEVVRADSATVLISKGGRARFEASIRGGGGEFGAVSIGDAKLGIAVRRSSSLGIEIAAQTDLTPLYTAYRVRKRWWSTGRWMVAKSDAGPLKQLSADDVLAMSTAGA